MNTIWDLGQLSKEEKKQLDKAVKEGKLIKQKAWFPYITSGVIQKTIYRPIGQEGTYVGTRV
jgi:hypothetical protein